MYDILKGREQRTGKEICSFEKDGCLLKMFMEGRDQDQELKI